GVVRAAVGQRELQAQVARRQFAILFTARRRAGASRARCRGNGIRFGGGEVLPGAVDELAPVSRGRDRVPQRQDDLRGAAGCETGDLEVDEVVGVAVLDVLLHKLLRDAGEDVSAGERRVAQTQD